MEVKVISSTVNPIDVISLAAGTSYKKGNSSLSRVEHCIKRNHLSVVEFANIVFRVDGISRACSHQLVRSRHASFCVSGDTVVRMASGKKKTVEELYNSAQDVNDRTLLRCVDEATGEINYDHISGVYYTGEKPVYEVTTNFGYKVKTTIDHRFLCEDGSWKTLGELSTGDRVMVNGENLYRDKEWLRSKYWDEGLSQAEIGAICGVTKNCIRRWVRIFGLQKPMGSWCIGKAPANKGKNKYNYEPMRRTSEKMAGRKPKNVARGSDKRGWKGEEAAVISKYERVYVRHERTGVCQNCGFVGATEFHHIEKDLNKFEDGDVIELCVACHHAIHKQEVRQRIIPNEIVSIAYVGTESVYDISMAGEHHNFIGNGFVLHNCQESQRYNKYEDMADSGDWYVIPPDIAADESLAAAYRMTMDNAVLSYAVLRQQGVKPEDARFVLPEATKTSITVGMNARELFHFFDTRLPMAAQWEIRELANRMHDAAHDRSDQWASLIDLYDKYPNPVN